jgi:hypothetical protein
VVFFRVTVRGLGRTHLPERLGEHLPPLRAGFEVCGTAMEITAAARLRFDVHEGEADARGIRSLRYSREDCSVPPEYTHLVASTPQPGSASTPRVSTTART